jgi:AcrR family transcriptional regulator
MVPEGPSHPRLGGTEVSRFDIREQEFNNVFRSIDECVIAAFDQGVERLSQILTQAGAPEQSRLDRVSAGLSAVLAFFDQEPRWARFLILDAPIAGAPIAERRDRALHVLAQVLAGQMPPGMNRAGFAPSAELRAELVVGGVFSAIRARMVEHPSEPLSELAPSLMGFIVAPYPGSRENLEVSADAGADESASRHACLPIRATYRTTRVLSAIGASPRLSNREIADAAGMSDEGQTSKLLRRLERRGLVENVGLGQAYGEANAWLLTGYGERVLAATRSSLAPGAGAVVRRRVRGTA